MNQKDTPPAAPEISEFDRAVIEAIQEPHARLRVIMKRLLDPGGCPWDREQTHATLKQYLIEESYEVCESIDEGDMASLCEELGDVGLQVVFHAELAERAGAFTLEDVYTAICTKLLDRHPHVFGETHAPDAATVLKNWEEIKREEKRARAQARGGAHPSALDGVPRALPSLQRALRLQEKASRVGFDWNATEEVELKVREEVEEFLELGAKAPADRIEEEFGDLLFSLVNLARFLSIRPEEALSKSCAKFVSRFHHIEDRVREQGRELADLTVEELDGLWDEAKKR
jgi:tetrapyrrole methylase family protein / MazG family protein